MSRRAHVEVCEADLSNVVDIWFHGDVPSALSQRPHYLRLVAGNGQILATSEIYSTLSNARRARRAWVRAFGQIVGAAHQAGPLDFTVRARDSAASELAAIANRSKPEEDS
jgi:hypothetical protein